MSKSASREIRSVDTVYAIEEKKIVGHAAVFNDISRAGRTFREMVAPGAFTQSIAHDDIRALFDHDTRYVLGRTKAGTLSLSEDEIGLYAEITPPDTQWARDLMVSIERGDISQMSFGFEIIDEEWRHDENDVPLRIIRGAKLWDVSPVTFPFYESTDLAVRSHHIFTAPRVLKMLRAGLRRKYRR